MSVLLAVAASLWLAPRPALAVEHELQLVTQDLARISVSLKNLTESGLSQEAVSGIRSATERMTDAEILYILADYGRASLVLYDIVNDPDTQRQPFHSKAIYYLAESLFQIGNDASAREQFQRLVDLRDPEHLRDAVHRLIQIGDRTRNWGGIDDRVKVLRAGGSLPPDIAYIHAKSLALQGRHDAAITTAAEVGSDNRLFAKAGYLTAVALVAQGKLEEASQRFLQVAKLQGDYDDLSYVRELAAMNAGRLFLESGKLAEAADAYQIVGRDSPVFDQALYEVAWNYVRGASMAGDDARDAEYRKAQNTLEILLLSENESTLAAEARLLLGNILLRLGKHQEATAVFDEVVQRYGPLREQVAAARSQNTAKERYYDELLHRKSTLGLPPLAVRWANENEEVQRAKAVVADLDVGESWIVEAQQLVDKLMTVLSSDRRASFFPSLREADMRRREAHNSLAAVSQRLVAIERELVEADITPAQAQELAGILSERQRLEPEYQKLPQSRAEYDSRTSEIKKNLGDLSKRAYQLRYPLKMMRSVLDIMEQWFAANGRTLSRDDAQIFRDRMAQQERELTELLSLQEAIEVEIARESSLLSVAMQAEAHDDEVRARYAQTLEREQAILRQAGASATGEKRRWLDEIDRQRQVIGAYHAELNSFGARLDAVVAEKARDVKERVLAEVRALAADREQLDSERIEARLVIGELAAVAVEEVQQRFAEIVLRADVGIVDVAWQLKEEETRLISRQVNEQRRELQVLDSEFKDVLTND